MPTVHLLIKGKVQGVFYRASAKRIADENDVKGWVQNTENGDVEVIASAPQEALDIFINWCRKGPAIAHVESVDVTELKDETFTDFIIKR